MLPLALAALHLTPHRTRRRGSFCEGGESSPQVVVVEEEEVDAAQRGSVVPSFFSLALLHTCGELQLASGRTSLHSTRQERCTADNINSRPAAV